MMGSEGVLSKWSLTFATEKSLACEVGYASLSWAELHGLSYCSVPLCWHITTHTFQGHLMSASSASGPGPGI